MSQHNIVKLMRQGLLVTINSDDPAYFGGYVNENYFAVAKAFNLSNTDIVELAMNSFKASFISDIEKQKALSAINDIAKPFLTKAS